MKKSEQEKLSQFKVIVDTREQTPYKFSGAVVKCLPYGDYTIEYDGKSYLDQIIFERKSSVSELFAFSGSQRDRFVRELEKMKDVKYKYLLCEFDLMAVVNDQPPGILDPSIVYSTLCSFAIKYQITPLFCGNRANGRAIMFKMMEFFVKYEILGVK